MDQDVSFQPAGALAHAQGQTSGKRVTSSELRKRFTWNAHDFIASGGFSCSYLGASRSTGRRYAVKLVSLSGHSDDARWRREFDHHLKFDHPNIVKMVCCAVGATEGYIVTEAADTDLRMMLDKREGRMSAEFSKSCVEQMMLGLGYMHARDVVHRDVNPSNTLLLIHHSGATAVTVQLCDLGLARYNPSTNVGPDRAMTALVQTDGYRAPEVLATEDTDTGYCHPGLDSWGVGCVALELFTRERFPAAGLRAAEQLNEYEKLLGPYPAGACWLSSRDGVWWLVPSEGTALSATPLLLRNSTWQDTSEAGRDFTMSCLAWEYELRPSAAAALRSSWLRGASDVAAGTPTAAAAAAPAATVATPTAAAAAAPAAAAAAHTRGDTTFGAAPAVRGFLEGAPCKCIGNCGNAKHRKGCGSTDATRVLRSGQESKHCRECTCELLSCLRPRLRGSLCSRHARLMSQLPESVRLHRSLAPGTQERLIPADVQNFVDWCVDPDTTDNLAVWLLVAWMKMPTSRRCFLEHLAPPQGCWSGTSLCEALRHAMEKEDAESHSPARQEEHRNLARQGATRTTGLAQVCRATGIAAAQRREPSTRAGAAGSGSRAARKRPREGDDQQRSALKLGAQQKPYVMDMQAGADIITKILELSRQVGPLPLVQSAESLGACVRVLVKFVSDVGSVLAPGQPRLQAGAYTAGYIVRLLTLGHLHRSLALSQGCDVIDWSALPLGSLQDACPDQKKLLEHFRESCQTAQEASEMMCSRSDWGLLVSMFGCLWQRVYDEEVGKTLRSDDDYARLLSEIQSEHFPRAVIAYHEKWGFAPHPSTVLAEMRAA